MEEISDSEGSDLIWNTQASFSSICRSPGDNGAASSSARPSWSNLVSRYVEMGFSKEMVVKAIDNNGEHEEAILEALFHPEHLTICITINFENFIRAGYALFAPDCDGLACLYTIPSRKEKKSSLECLEDMGYPTDEASIAIDSCGPEASILDLTDFIFAAQLARKADVYRAVAPEVPSSSSLLTVKKRCLDEEDTWKRKRGKTFENKLRTENDHTSQVSNPMVGFRLPGDSMSTFPKRVPDAVKGPPFFYFEKSCLSPILNQSRISYSFNEIEPEFVDSKEFCVAAKKGALIHNLPIHNRSPLLPIPPQTIHEALPVTKQFWPSWDKRTKLDSVQSLTVRIKLTEKIKKILEGSGDDPPPKVQKYIEDECKTWNLVWVGKNKVAPLEPDEIETLLGFSKNHTRGGGVSKTERIRGLNSSFQVDTIAFHLSVLRDMFPNGIKVLSFFSGIGGAEVALDRLGIYLKVVVSVEISEANRNILGSWWESTEQKGKLVQISDVQQMDMEKLEELTSSFGNFDLVIGGNPCKDLSGHRRSELFSCFLSVLNWVMEITRKN